MHLLPRRGARLAAGVVALGLLTPLLAACTITRGGDDAQASPSASVTPTESIEPTEEPDKCATADPDDLGCKYDQTGMADFYQDAIDWVETFRTESYASMPAPDHYWFIPLGGVQDSACGPLDQETYAYCPGDRSVYVGEDFLWVLYSQAGDLGAIAGLAHEFGHHLQTIVGVPSPLTDRQTIPHEDQADCVAGAFIGFADAKGALADDDLEDIDKMLDIIQDYEGSERSHGTLSERKEAINIGYQRGLAGCNDWYPETPLITA